MADATPFLRISLDGKLVAEADIVVHDQDLAWDTFIKAYPTIAHLVAGELFATLHIACDEELKKLTQHTGLSIDLSTRPPPQLYVPQNGHEMRGF